MRGGAAIAPASACSARSTALTPPPSDRAGSGATAGVARSPAAPIGSVRPEHPEAQQVEAQRRAEQVREAQRRQLDRLRRARGRGTEQRERPARQAEAEQEDGEARTWCRTRWRRPPRSKVMLRFAAVLPIALSASASALAARLGIHMPSSR